MGKREKEVEERRLKRGRISGAQGKNIEAALKDLSLTVKNRLLDTSMPMTGTQGMVAPDGSMPSRSRHHV